jgi:glucose-1-phosphate thymidylyltransferase
VTVISLEPDPRRPSAAADARGAAVRTSVLLVSEQDALPSLTAVANRPLIAHVAASLLALGAERALIVAAPGIVDRIRAGVAGAPGCDAVDVLPCSAVGHAHEFVDVLRAIHGAVGDEPLLLQSAGGLLCETPESLSDVVTSEPRVVLLTSRRQGPAPAARLTDRRLLKLVGGPVRDVSVRPTGAVILGRGVLAQALEIAARETHFTGLELLDAVSAAGVPVESRPATGWHPYTGHVADLLDLNRRILDDLQDARPEVDFPGSHLHGRISVHPTATIESAVIRGPVVIGPGARIVDAYVGPYTAIGQGVVIEGAEVEHSILLEGARVMHVGRRLEASVIGRDAHVFRDFAMPRALRLFVGDNAEVALC